MTAEICRDEAAPAAGTPCVPLTRLPATAGAPAEFQDALPFTLTQGAPRLIFYRVRVLNDKGKGGVYDRVMALAGEAPAPMVQVAASPIAGGVAVRWRPDSSQGESRIMLRVDRGIAKSAPGSVPAQGSHKSGKSGTPTPEGTLLAVDSAMGDAGGAIDTGARIGIEQRYTVYRSRTANFAGHSYVMDGTSASVTVAATAQAPPPAPPTGLEAVANTLAAPEIDLVWQASTEPAVTGYLVYRAEGDATPVQLTPKPIPNFSYADKAVRAGGRYRYSVAAVNAQGAAGARSGEAIETVPAQ